MADPIITATIQVTLEAALSLASDGIGRELGFKKDVARIKESLDFITVVLADAEEKQQNQDEAVQEWLKRLKEVAYDAYNVLDELHYESLRQKVESRIRQKVCFCFSFSNINLAFRWRMTSKIRDIKLKLNEINQEAHELRLVDRSVGRVIFHAASAATDTISRQTDSVSPPLMIGRADDESKIVEMLLSPSDKVVSVLPITGMAGIGKTTLAQSIYNNKQIDEHFNKKLWVCVAIAKEVPIAVLFKLILEQLTKQKVEVDDRNVIIEELQNQLSGRRYFLVLDDVWDDNQALWDDFFITLKGINPTNGSWCLVTTRLDSVARSVSGALNMKNDAYPLGRLDDDKCWSILIHKVGGGQEASDELKAIEERVKERCGGLPLAASVIGGLLRSNRKEEWESILENKLLSSSAGEFPVVQMLKLSFDNLPSPYIKKCFAYCSLFPKDSEIERNMLIELWMAEGFLQVDVNNKTMMEEIGMNYLRILLENSLFEEIRYDSGGTYYRMHDLVHQLAQSVSRSTGNLVHELAVDSFVIDSFGARLFESLSTSLHTLFVRSSSLSGDMLMKLKNLYVLNLSGAKNQKLPNSIGKLIHLRYIDFSDSGSETLPESACELYNLQTLRLNSDAVKALPKEMRNLISMRHLHYQNTDDKFEMPLEIGLMTCLQTLEFFNVGREKGRQIGELGCLKNLKGRLEIRNLQLVKDKEEAEEANLSQKPNLFRLHLQWPQDREGNNHDKDVLDGLQPHPNLEELKIRGFMGDQFPEWSMDLPTKLPKSVSLGFDNCNRCSRLPPLQNLTSLKELTIHKCGELENLPSDMLQSCTSLQKLRVTDCDNLVSFPLDLQQTPSLLEVWLFRCPKLKTSMTPKGFGFLTNLRELAIGPFSDYDDDQENSSIYNVFDWYGLISSSSSSASALCELQLYGLPHMDSLPHQLQYLTTLTRLSLYNFGGIKALPEWFENFAALEELRLYDFKELRYLPSEDAMRSLNKLKYLEVVRSSLLKERCTPESSGPGSQWSKVSHIQDLFIC